jgi:hypothetical protein
MEKKKFLTLLGSEVKSPRHLACTVTIQNMLSQLLTNIRVFCISKAKLISDLEWRIILYYFLNGNEIRSGCLYTTGRCRVLLKTEVRPWKGLFFLTVPFPSHNKQLECALKGQFYYSSLFPALDLIRNLPV